MTRSRDNPDPTLIISGNRSRVPSDRLADPSNGEPLDPAHQSSVAKSACRDLVATITVLIDQIESLCSSLPKSVPKGTKNDRIYYALNKIKRPDTGVLANLNSAIASFTVHPPARFQDSFPAKINPATKQVKLSPAWHPRSTLFDPTSAFDAHGCIGATRVASEYAATYWMRAAHDRGHGNRPAVLRFTADVPHGRYPLHEWDLRRSVIEHGRIAREPRQRANSPRPPAFPGGGR
ncbi:hypothetical protein B0H13DRAFT_1897476 [Mycena leptocephala]|nr:hypothetical protein B0H13DRAFT_1897476 [Mycena leptocephala]